MRRHIGPTVPKWQLGDPVHRPSTAMGIDQAEVAKPPQLLREHDPVNYETGKVSMTKSRARQGPARLLQITDEAEREQYFELASPQQDQGLVVRAWQVPPSFQQFLGIESAAANDRELQARDVPWTAANRGICPRPRTCDYPEPDRRPA